MPLWPMQVPTIIVDAVFFHYRMRRNGLPNVKLLTKELKRVEVMLEILLAHPENVTILTEIVFRRLARVVHHTTTRE